MVRRAREIYSSLGGKKISEKISSTTGQNMNSGACEGNYNSLLDGKIYQYEVSYEGGEWVSWRASVSWGQTVAFSREGTISHNILAGHSLQELVRAHVIAAIQHALGESAA